MDIELVSEVLLTDFCLIFLARSHSLARLCEPINPETGIGAASNIHWVWEECDRRQRGD